MMTAHLGAQTGRRGGTGPVGACLAVRTPPAASLQVPGPSRAILLTRSKLAEPAVELAVVPAVHVAVPVEVEVPQVAGVGGDRPERGPEEVAVLPVHVAVPVRVAEQPGEAVHPVASAVAVTIPVEFPALPVADVVAPNGQRVVAVRQRAAHDTGPREGQDGDGATIRHRGRDTQAELGAVVAPQHERAGV